MRKHSELKSPSACFEKIKNDDSVPDQQEHLAKIKLIITHHWVWINSTRQRANRWSACPAGKWELPGGPLRYTEHIFLLLMRAGTKATCCWLSAVLSQSCCVQTCWLLSAADSTDATVGHRGVSKGRETVPPQYITIKRHTGWSVCVCVGGGHAWDATPPVKGRSDLVLFPPSASAAVSPSLTVYLSACPPPPHTHTHTHTRSHADRLEGMKYAAHVSESISRH